MAETENRQGWFSDRAAVSTLAAVSGILAALLVLTQLQYVLLAVVLAYVLAPAQRRLERHLRPVTAALVLISISIFVLLIPVAYILTVAIQQGLELLTAIQEGELSPEIIQDRIETICSIGLLVGPVVLGGTKIILDLLA